MRNIKRNRAILLSAGLLVFASLAISCGVTVKSTVATGYDWVGVEKIVVVGVEDADGLTKPHAFVVAKEGASQDGLAAELQAFVREKLDAYKYPRQVVFLPDLPRTHLRKVARGKLRFTFDDMSILRELAVEPGRMYQGLEGGMWAMINPRIDKYAGIMGVPPAGVLTFGEFEVMPNFDPSEIGNTDYRSQVGRRSVTDQLRTRGASLFAADDKVTGDAAGVAKHHLGNDDACDALAIADGDVINDVSLVDMSAGQVELVADGIRRSFMVTTNGDQVIVSSSLGVVVATRMRRFVEPSADLASGSLVAAMPGTIRAVAVAEGDKVEAGQTVVVMEAMKMELAVEAPAAGTVTAVHVSLGDTINAGDPLVVIE